MQGDERMLDKVGMNGGEVQADSAPGKGTEIRFILRGAEQQTVDGRQ